MRIYERMVGELYVEVAVGCRSVDYTLFFEKYTHLPCDLIPHNWNTQIYEYDYRERVEVQRT